MTLCAISKKPEAVEAQGGIHTNPQIQTKNRFEEFQEPYNKDDDEEFPEIDSNMIEVRSQKMKTVDWRKARRDRAAATSVPPTRPNYPDCSDDFTKINLKKSRNSRKNMMKNIEENIEEMTMMTRNLENQMKTTMPEKDDANNRNMLVRSLDGYARSGAERELRSEEQNSPRPRRQVDAKPGRFRNDLMGRLAQPGIVGLPNQPICW